MWQEPFSIGYNEFELRGAAINCDIGWQQPRAQNRKPIMTLKRLPWFELSILLIVALIGWAEFRLLSLESELVQERERLGTRSEEHTSELQSRGLISYACFCL